MSLAPPPLQSRSFEDMLTEARRRIGRATPEYTAGWTDHNESDPGMVLLELFIWLAQVTQERVNQLPPRAYQSMLHLLGLDIQPATSARADLVFTPAPGVRSGRSVPARTAVGAPPAEDGTPVVFETTRALDVITAELAHVLVFDGDVFTDVTERNEPDGGGIHPFGDRPQDGAAIYFGFAIPKSAEDGWRPFPGRLALRAFERDARTTDAIISCGAIPQPRRAALEWQYLPGPNRKWEALTIFEDDTRALENGGYLLLEGPRDIQPAPLWTFSDPANLNYWVRLRVGNPDYGRRVPHVEFFRFNTVPAVHRVTVEDQVIGASTGAQDQILKLPVRPIVPGSIELVVADEGGNLQDWTRVDQFRSEPDDENDTLAGRDAMVYQLDPDKGEIRFGDGYRGAIPAPGSEVIARRYEYGGGAAGNAEADAITSLQTTLGAIRGVTNPRAAIGGRDAETVEQALRKAPQWLRRNARAVTPADYIDVASRVGGVARAEAISNAHPDYPGVRVPGAVTVLIAQDTTRNPPDPSEDLMRAVCVELDKRRTLTTEVYVRGPRFVRIDVDAKLTIDPTKSTSAAEDRARVQIREYLSPIPLEPRTSSGKLWRLGQDLYPANLQSQLLSLSELGIRAVPSLRIRVDGVLHESPTDPIEFERDQLPYAGTLAIHGEPDNEP